MPSIFTLEGASYGKLADTSASLRNMIPPWLKVVSTGATMLGAYHGYGRHRSVGWSVVWALSTCFFWPVAIPVMLVQGLGKPLSSTPSKPPLAGLIHRKRRRSR